MKDVPPLGMIAVTLRQVSAIQKDLIMQLQAIARTLNSVDSHRHNARNEALRLSELVYDLKAEPNCGNEGVTPVFAKSFIGRNSPQWLTSAQALDHYADVVTNLMGAPHYTNTEICRGLEALATIALESAFENAGQENIGNENIRRDITALHKAYSYKLKHEYGIDLKETGAREELISKLRDNVRDALPAVEGPKIEGAATSDIARLLEIRFEQITSRGISSDVPVIGK